MGTKVGKMEPKVGKMDLKVGRFEPKVGKMDSKVGKRDPKGTEWDPKCPPRFSCTVQHEELPLPLSYSVYRNTGREMGQKWGK